MVIRNNFNRVQNEDVLLYKCYFGFSMSLSRKEFTAIAVVLCAVTITIYPEMNCYTL